MGGGGGAPVQSDSVVVSINIKDKDKHLPQDAVIYWIIVHSAIGHEQKKCFHCE